MISRRNTFTVVEFVSPDDDCLEGERALAQAGDHRLAAGLYAFCDRDFAFARQQLDRAHFAQINAHRIIGPLAGLGFLGLCRSRALHFNELAVAFFPFGFPRRLLGLGFFRFDDVDPHLAEHHQDVFDLLGPDLLRGQQRVDLVVGDVAALLGAVDQLLDRVAPEVDRRAVGRGLGTVLLQNLFLLFRRKNAGQLNAYMTLNIRGKRSKTDAADNNPQLMDALETARVQDAGPRCPGLSATKAPGRARPRCKEPRTTEHSTENVAAGFDLWSLVRAIIGQQSSTA
jgi:hypothetical protein